MCSLLPYLIPLPQHQNTRCTRVLMLHLGKTPARGPRVHFLLKSHLPGLVKGKKSQKLVIPSSWRCLQRAKVRWWQVIFFPPFPGPAANSPDRYDSSVIKM